MKITIYRDNTPTIKVQVLHQDGSVVDLTGCMIEMCFKTDQDIPNSQAFITKNTSDNSIVITDQVNGIFNVLLVTADTQSLEESTIFYTDILITDQSGRVFTVANTTTVEVKANYTRKSNA